MSQYRRGDVEGRWSSHWSDRIHHQQSNDRIPPIAWVGALTFVLFWLGLFNLGGGF